ncbi:MAG: FHA domain-containing protein, partial [Planctomycetales bacterium]|nr:FHA domain-containing protein [Planctomycetales bacterium]
MNGKIVVLRGERTGETFLVRRGDRLVIGRDSLCNIPFGDEGLAPAHLAIEGKGEGFLITALDGAAALTVNGAAVSTKALREGDVVEAGTLRFRFSLVPEPVAASRSQRGLRLVEDTAGLVERKVAARVEPEAVAADAVKASGKTERRLAILCRVGAAVNAETDRARILESVVDSALEALGGERGFLLLYDRSVNALQPAVVRTGDSPPTNGP